MSYNIESFYKSAGGKCNCPACKQRKMQQAGAWFKANKDQIESGLTNARDQETWAKLFKECASKPGNLPIDYAETAHVLKKIAAQHGPDFLDTKELDKDPLMYIDQMVSMTKADPEEEEFQTYVPEDEALLNGHVKKHITDLVYKAHTLDQPTQHDLQKVIDNAKAANGTADQETLDAMQRVLQRHPMKDVIPETKKDEEILALLGIKKIRKLFGKDQFKQADSKKFCTKCGAQGNAGDIFCTKCGNKL